MSVSRVIAWRDRLRREGPSERCGLSPEGARHAWEVCLEALTDAALMRATSMPGRPYSSACIIAASTVPAAPLEWCAVLLGRGTAVTLRPSRRNPGWSTQIAQAAQEVGLPLKIGEDQGAQLVVAMGSDETLATLAPQVAGHFLGFGTRLSWAVTDTEFDGVASDLALHDSRGCMSPVALLTTLDLSTATDRMAEAMDRAQHRWPVGERAPAELAAIRERRALTRVVGTLREGAGWSVHGLPVPYFTPLALPRSLAVLSLTDPQAFLSQRTTPVSTIGTSLPVSLPGVRICRPGEMQRPPLARLHDGVDWLRATLRPEPG